MYDMKWEDLKSSPEKLVEIVNEISTRGVGEKYDISKDTVNYWLKKHGFTYSVKDSKWVKQNSGNIDDFEEYLKTSSPDNIHIETNKDKYIITKDDEFVEIDSDKLKDIYYDYCELELTIEETCYKNNIIRDDFMLIKKVFDIIHDSLPLTDKEILENSVEQNIKKILYNKKRKIKEKKPVEELKYLRKIADKYFEKHHEAQRVINNIKDKLDSFNYEPVECEYTPVNTDMVITLNDIHYGKQVIAKDVFGVDGDVNRVTIRERLDKYMREIMHKIEMYKPENVYIAFLGDILDNPISNTYPGQIYNQDVTGEDQVLECADMLANFIGNINNCANICKVIVVPGNHTDERIDSDFLIGGIVQRLLKHTDIEFNLSKTSYKHEIIRGNNFVFFHGQNLSRGRNTRENDIFNIIHSLGLQGSDTYLLSAHDHHEDTEGVNYEHKKLPTIIGSDGYAKEKLNVGARPAQMFFVVEESGMTGRYKVYFD